MARRGPHLSCKTKRDLGLEKDFIFLVDSHESEKREIEDSQELPSKIYGVPLVEVRQVKNESSLHQ